MKIFIFLCEIFLFNLNKLYGRVFERSRFGRAFVYKLIYYQNSPANACNLNNKW